jgi:hypothetical protein
MRQILEILKPQMNETEKGKGDRPSRILKMESGSHNKEYKGVEAKRMRMNRYLCENKKIPSQP